MIKGITHLDAGSIQQHQDAFTCEAGSDSAVLSLWRYQIQVLQLHGVAGWGGKCPNFPHHPSIVMYWEYHLQISQDTCSSDVKSIPNSWDIYQPLLHGGYLS